MYYIIKNLLINIFYDFFRNSKIIMLYPSANPT